MSKYYEDLQLISGGEVPRCRIQIQRDFGETVVINYLWRGKIHFAASGEKSTILEGPMAYWTLPRTFYIYGDLPKEEWHQLWVLARGPRLKRMMAGGLIPSTSHPWVRPPEPELYLEKMQTLIRWVRRGRVSDQSRKAALFEQLFVELTGEVEEEKDGADSRRRVDRLSDRIAAAPEKEWNFRTEAKSAGISYDHLRRLFKERTGAGPLEYLLDCRMRKAAELLRSGVASVKEAAYRSGFRDPHHLGRVMRSRWSISPSSLS